MIIIPTFDSLTPTNSSIESQALKIKTIIAFPVVKLKNKK